MLQQLFAIPEWLIMGLITQALDDRAARPAGRASTGQNGASLT
jgi:hypothetical protein